VLGTSWDHHHHHVTQSSHSINAIAVRKAGILLFLVRVLGTSWDKGCMAASASGNSAAGLGNQIRLVGVYGQLVGLRLPL
jgi:hypothetical protein